MRDAPALSILPPLCDKGAKVRAHDPQGMDEAKSMLPRSLEYFDSAYAAITDADAVVLMTEWNEYRGLNPSKIKELMKGDVFVDLRNVYEPSKMRDAGLNYYGVGR
jgi:UDPglucose 6-dehydrogenase